MSNIAPNMHYTYLAPVPLLRVYTKVASELLMFTAKGVHSSKKLHIIFWRRVYHPALSKTPAPAGGSGSDIII